ncbi:beta-ketoacyl-[acyl-carrier-protein] synthase family protein [Roseicyclus amphidinii]|uniref:beta-ketoacyl-[acyl-carrier-protein] synthase family protein n=1 Tax=Roseicyclus amphidinii TaxID=3034232 RepID=UPI0024E0FCC4|nr:beta-ketoacyl-[acyl-carrier-protein] synthase family protein [Roseicyclus sp. Amp-Y-6]
MRRVAITGIGLVTPLGKDWNAFCEALASGRSAIQPTLFSQENMADLTLPAAMVEEFDPRVDVPGVKANSWDRSSHFAIYAARQAAQNAGVTGDGIEALILGSSTTSIDTVEENYQRYFCGNGRMSPMAVAKSMPNAPVSAVSIDLGISGISYAVASACNSANQAIINAATMIQHGVIDTAMAGAVESNFTHGNVSAWNAMRVLSQDTCRPFCTSRSGLVLGEGGVVFVLEDLERAQAQERRIYAEITGWGQSSDAQSMTTPYQAGIEKALRTALIHADIAPCEIDYINAHGTGTDLNDPTEAAALDQVFSRALTNIPVTSTKGMHGHLLGASGAIELAATLAGMEHSFVPPNVGLQDQIEGSKFRSPIIAEPYTIQTAMSASYAFGGHNSVLVVTRHDEQLSRCR